MGIFKFGFGLAAKGFDKVSEAIDDGKAIADGNAKRFAGKKAKKSVAKKFMKMIK